ncbi:MAG TPA: GAF domain-containing protein [Candidatus Competibacteraceae bacterium]|nr:GAF domain-containing protein [Candidatus Competibacteraceae bacterium]HPF57570.1 GAF domain-containing protein [Candidatus Competibacteraceae bacterium]HRY16909.1 GAF domain-containing protein [Candidatus Competibacteraceae bacterium]
MADGQKSQLLAEVTALQQRLAKLEASLPASASDVLHEAAEALALNQLNEERLNSLLTLSEQAHHLTEQDIISLGLEEAVRLTQSWIGYFHFINDDQQTLQLFAWSRETFKTCTAAPDHHYAIEMAGVWADCARKRQPVIHNDYQNLPNKRGYPPGHSHLIRHMSVPVIEQDKVRMIIGVGNKPDDYDETDARQLLLIARHIWKIICRHRIEARTQRLNRFYATLNQVNKALTRVQDRKQLFHELHRITSDCELFTAVWIGLLDAETGRMTVVAGGLDPALGMPCPELAMTECCVIGDALRRGVPLLCTDLQNGTTIRSCGQMAQQADIHASIALPILEQGQAIGVFVAYASEIGFFDEALINLLREMMDDISFGLDALIS